MSTLRHPVGPQPPEVYWRRRLVVGLGLLAVIVIIVLIVWPRGSGDPTEQPSPDPQSTESAAPGDEVAEGDAAACTAAQVEVTPVTDASSYPAGQQPMLSFTLLNTATAPCTMPVGADVQEFLIVSGSDRIWASTDCQEPAVPASVVLEPGEALESTPIAWSRTRSTPGDCDAARPDVIAGGATYRLSVTVGEFASEGDRPFILN